jgi:thioredoxin 1
MAGNVLTFSDDNFQKEVLESSQPVLVDFWAPWCVPCNMLTPTIDALATEYQGRLRIGKVNIDDNPKTASSYRISAIPALMLFKGGQIVAQFVGVPQKDKLVASLNANLG